MSEDWELIARAIKRGVKVKRPLVFPFYINKRGTISRYGEQRYINNRLQYYTRRIRIYNDSVIGCRLSPAHIYYMEPRFSPSLLLWMIISSLHTIGRNTIPVQALVYHKSQYILPEELGLPREWLLTWYEQIDILWPYISPTIKTLLEEIGDPKTLLLPETKTLIIYRDRRMAEKWIKTHSCAYTATHKNHPQQNIIRG